MPLSHPPHRPEGAESLSSSSEGIFLVFILAAGVQGRQGAVGSVTPSMCRTASSPAPSCSLPTSPTPVCAQSSASWSPPSVHAWRGDPCCRHQAPIPAGRTAACTPLPAPSSPGKGGKSRGAAPVWGLAPQQRREQGGPYLGSAEERGSVREAAGGGEGHSLLQEPLQLRRAGLGLRLRQALPQPAAWGAGLQREPCRSTPTRLLGRGDARVDGSILHPRHFGRILIASTDPGGVFFAGGRQRLTSS